jgi:hypothetical protein
MASAGSRAEGKLLEILANGLSGSIEAVSEAEGTPLEEIPAGQIVRQNVSADLKEKSAGANYPAIQLYCERLSNLLREKFRRLSGQAHMVIEVRVSQDRLEGLERVLQLYTDAVMQVLDANRGDWGEGLFYAGGYETVFGAVKRGGRAFIQAARITLEVEVSN